MKKTLCLVCILMIGTMNIALAGAFGGMDPGAINSQSMRDLRMHEVSSRVKQKSAIVQPKTSLQEQIAPDVVNKVLKINFVGNAQIPTSELNVVVKDKINKPMDHKNLSAIRKDLMRYYQANGYYSAVPIIVSQNNITGELVIQIEEGSKNSITIE